MGGRFHRGPLKGIGPKARVNSGPCPSKPIEKPAGLSRRASGLPPRCETNRGGPDRVKALIVVSHAYAGLDDMAEEISKQKFDFLGTAGVAVLVCSIVVIIVLFCS